VSPATGGGSVVGGRRSGSRGARGMLEGGRRENDGVRRRVNMRVGPGGGVSGGRAGRPQHPRLPATAWSVVGHLRHHRKPVGDRLLLVGVRFGCGLGGITSPQSNTANPPSRLMVPDLCHFFPTTLAHTDGNATPYRANEVGKFHSLRNAPPPSLSPGPCAGPEPPPPRPPGRKLRRHREGGQSE